VQNQGAAPVGCGFEAPGATDRLRPVMRVVSYPEADLPEALRLQQAALQDQAWPSGPTTPPGLRHDPALHPVSLLLVDDGGRVLSALDILSKRITHLTRDYAASALSAVVTHPGHRGRGYGSRLVAAARDLMAGRGADLGIFTCDRSLQHFYEGAGWQHLVGTVLVGGTPEDPFPSDQFDKVALGGFFSARARAAASDFVGARVGLYSGEIDRLW